MSVVKDVLLRVMLVVRVVRVMEVRDLVVLVVVSEKDVWTTELVETLTRELVSVCVLVVVTCVVTVEEMTLERVCVCVVAWKNVIKSVEETLEMTVSVIVVTSGTVTVNVVLELGKTRTYPQAIKLKYDVTGVAVDCAGENVGKKTTGSRC